MGSILAAYWSQAPAAFWLLVAGLTGFAVVGGALGVYDARTRRLPDRIVLPSYPAAGILLAGAAGTAGEWHRAGSMLAGAACLGAACFLVRVLHPPAMGFGDVKLAGLLGLYLGFAGWAFLGKGAAAAVVLGGIWALFVVATERGTAASRMPFGPFLVAGAGAALLELI